MILGDRSRDMSSTDGGRLPTLDELFRSAVARKPDAVALVDPPNRDSFADGLPRRLSYAKADRVVSAIARRLLEFGLPTDAIVGIQMPNVVESVLVMLGVLRAGMIAAPLPLLWRRTEMAAALGRVGARALIVPRRVGSVDHGDIARYVAAETFSIRFVCGFGEGLPDGVVPLDNVFDVSTAHPVPPQRPGAPADHVAMVTFDVTSEGMVPVARSHAEIVAIGAAVVSEVGTRSCAAIISALATSSLAGLASVIMPWLLTDAKLVLHHPFAAHVFAAQCSAEHCTLTAVPGPLVSTLSDAQLLGGSFGPSSVLAVWRAPERLAGNAAWTGTPTTLIDLCAFGEIGLTVGRRQDNGRASTAALAPASPTGHAGGSLMGVEAMRTASGTLALRGAVVARHPFPPGTERDDPLRLKVIEGGFVDTGYPCRLDRETNRLVVTGPPAGIVGIGGYRFSLRELQQLVARVDPDGSVAALPDTLSGHRLAGLSDDRDGVRRTLTAEGANPLLAAAFRDRRPIDSASAA